MKPAGNKLFLLIRSLSPAEKRHFRRQSTLHGKESLDYMVLLDALEAMAAFSDTELREKLRDAAFLPHLPVIKEQLYQRLLDSLHLFHKDQSPEERIKKGLHQVYILLQKGLDEQAERLLTRIKKQLTASGQGLFWPEFRDLERIMLEKQFKTGLSAGQLDAWRTGYAAQLDDLRQGLEYGWLKSEMARLHVQRVRLTEEQAAVYRETFRQPAPFSPGRLSPPARADYHQARSLFYFMQGDKGGALASNQELLTALDQFPEYGRFAADRYLSTLYNLLIDQLQLGDHTGLSRGLEKLRALQHRPAFKRIQGLDARIFQWSSQLEMNSLITQRKYPEAFEKVPEIARQLYRLENQLPPQVVVTIRYLLGLISFQVGQYPQALEYITPLYQENRPAVAGEIYRYALWLYLLAHYAAGHYQLLEHLLVSARRQASQRRDTLKAERLLLVNLRKLTVAAGQAGQKKIILNWQKDIQLLTREESEKRFFEYLDLANWLNKQA